MAVLLFAECTFVSGLLCSFAFDLLLIATVPPLKFTKPKSKMRWRALLSAALHVAVLSKARQNALPADQLNAVKDGQPLTGAQGDSVLDVATAGMVVGQECLPDTPAKACYPVLPAKDAPEIKDAAGKLLGSANSHAYLAFYGGGPM